MCTVNGWCGDDCERDSGDGSAACDPGICIKKRQLDFRHCEICIRSARKLF